MAKLIAIVMGLFKKEEVGDGSFVRLEDNSPESAAYRMYLEVKTAGKLTAA